jgi:hypothetical protein
MLSPMVLCGHPQVGLLKNRFAQYAHIFNVLLFTCFWWCSGSPLFEFLIELTTKDKVDLNENCAAWARRGDGVKSGKVLSIVVAAIAAL